MTLFDRFQDGGWGMYPTFVLGVLLPRRRGEVRGLARAAVLFLGLLVALNVATLASGALGFVTGVIVTAHAVSSRSMVEPTNISFVGVGEALEQRRLRAAPGDGGDFGRASVGAFKLSRVSTRRGERFGMSQGGGSPQS